jgi:peptidoglycan hydrolase-like protein with peptidoglycan-binding domain
MFPTLSLNDKGEAVRFLQQLLLSSGFLTSEDFNAEFKASTQQAVRTFQDENNLRVDGIVGAQTWDALILQVDAHCALTPMH